MLDQIADGGGVVALGTALGLALAFGLETWLVRRTRVGGLAPFPLGRDVAPLTVPVPDGEGRGRGVAWRVRPDGRVQWHVVGRELPRGLHGVADLKQDTVGRVHVDVRWGPWWTPFLALGWLGVLAASRGDWALLPLPALFGGLILVLYLRGADQAARALRCALLDAMERDG